jgi:hypothetical protein
MFKTGTSVVPMGIRVRFKPLKSLQNSTQTAVRQHKDSQMNKHWA